MIPKKLYLQELINFYDYKVINSNTHAAAINAVLGEDLAIALISHYFKSIGYQVRALDLACTQGTQKGYRLDKWIEVRSTSENFIFQVEIKNWSAHSIGGRSIRADSDEAAMCNYRVACWARRFDVRNKVPAEQATLKVLTKMRTPSSPDAFTNKALLCFWEALHPEGAPLPFFEVDVISESFKKLSVFSMSNYVRELLKTTEFLDVEMPNADARIDWLNRIYS